MILRTRFLLVALMLPLATCTLGADMGSVPPSSPESRAESGRALFRVYCASCHGVQAKGDGPVAVALRDQPSHLTRIAERRERRFPALEIAEYIDGWKRVTAHGTSDMPVWGRRLGQPGARPASEETLLGPGQIFLLVEYLRAIQELD